MNYFVDEYSKNTIGSWEKRMVNSISGKQSAIDWAVWFIGYRQNVILWIIPELKGHKKISLCWFPNGLKITQHKQEV